MIGPDRFITLWYNAIEPLLKTMACMVSWISIHDDDGCVDVDAVDVDLVFPGGMVCCCMP